VWPDVFSQLCDSNLSSDYVEPAGQVTVALPPGQGRVEATIKGVNFKAVGSMLVQITPVTIPPFFGRVFYDTPDMNANVSFKCIPARGKSCV
jgi:hypothetical protein